MTMVALASEERRQVGFGWLSRINDLLLSHSRALCLGVVVKP